MIEFINGILASKSPSEAVIDVRGVGFRIAIPAGTFDALGQPGEEVTLLTRLVHRDDAMELYGFATELERVLYDRLIRASGVGPKMAIKILSGMRTSDLIEAIRMRDYKMLTSIPGLGRKRAERLCVELADALKDIDIPIAPVGMTAAVDAIDALVALGFQRSDTAKAIREVVDELGDVSADELIRETLNRLNKTGNGSRKRRM